MGPPRRFGLSTLDAIVVAAIVLVLLVLALAGAIGSASGPKRSAQEAFASHRFGFSSRVPAGWHRSATSLVPKLILPREILSLGTFAMPVGGGGNCGREPVAAIERMRPGDALISIQEYEVTPRMRSQLARTMPLLGSYSSPRQLELRRFARATLPNGPGSGRTWSATVPFRAHGRGFDALVYLDGKPSPERLREIVSVLQDLEFRPGDYVGLPG